MKSKHYPCVDAWIASPNFDERPADSSVDAIIIHAISLPPDKFGARHVEKLFCNCLPADEHPYFAEVATLRVSAHFYIKRCGYVVQFVDTDQRAWHAGVSKLAEREQVNDFSIGIELEGSDHCPFEDVQYAALGALTQNLCERYPAITPERIVGHCDIAPGRKTDPGPHFDWPHYRSLMQSSNK